jgi:Ca2+-binding EF-hand superfamily protein
MFIRFVLVSLLVLPVTALSQGLGRGTDFLEKMDGDGDGRVTRDEFIAGRAELFAKRDRNSDGYLDRADLGKRAARRMGNRKSDARDRLDTNGDGKISKDEFVSGDTPMFGMADKNDDGVLDSKELEAAKAAMRERMKQRQPE